ncbi:MAG: shikimate dehydrogenase family protein [Anaerolineae bacterium]
MSPPPALDAPRRYGLLGWPLGASLSPALHNAAFRSLGLAAVYDLIPVPPRELPRAVDDLQSGAVAGANVTIPHKVSVAGLLDELSDDAARIGAVNTIVRTATGLRGHNTDGVGFAAALVEVGLGAGPEAGGCRAGLSGAGRSGVGRSGAGRSGAGRALVLGAGGAARAVVDALLASGWAVTVLARQTVAAAALLDDVAARHPGADADTAPLSADEVAERATGAELLVNATPVGGPRQPDNMLWPPGTRIPATLAVVDLVAWPTTSRLVRLARDSGASACGGLPMLIAQAAASFKLWTGLDAPIAEMQRAAEAAATLAGMGEPNQ